jgi:hypothetical protein
MLKRLKQAWKRDRLGVLGVGSAVAAFTAWAFPKWECARFDYIIYAPPWADLSDRPCRAHRFFDAFSDERLPIAGAFLALAVILLLLRRR